MLLGKDWKERIGESVKQTKLGIPNHLDHLGGKDGEKCEMDISDHFGGKGWERVQNNQNWIF